MKTRTYVALMLTVILILSVGLTALYVHMEQKTTDKEDATVSIVTSFYPLYTLALNLTKDVPTVQVVNMSEPQTGCLHDYQMTPEDMRLLSTADIFLVNGGGIESFLPDVQEEYKDLNIITATSKLDLISEGDKHEEDGHQEDEHGLNAHAWMSVTNYRMMVQYVAEELAKVDSDHAKEYMANAQVYDTKLAQLSLTEEQLKKQLNEARVPVVIFHEAFAYLANELGWDVKYCLDLDEERQLSAGEVAETLDMIHGTGTRFILAEATYGSDMGKTAEEETDAIVFYLNPLTRAGDYKGDPADYYLVEMQKNLQLIMQEVNE